MIRSLTMLAAGTLLVTGARLAAQSPPKPIAIGVIEAKAEAIAEVQSVSVVASAEAKLKSEGMDAGRAHAFGDRIRERLRTDLLRHARTNASRMWDEAAAQRWLEWRWRILAWNAIERPSAYAQGFVVPWVVDAGDAELLRIGLDARVRHAEEAIRKRVRDLAAEGLVAWTEVNALRDYTRNRAKVRGRAEIERMQGAAFWSKEDAQRWLDAALAEEMKSLSTALEQDLPGTLATVRGRTAQ